MKTRWLAYLPLVMERRSIDLDTTLVSNLDHHALKEVGVLYGLIVFHRYQVAFSFADVKSSSGLPLKWTIKGRVIVEAPDFAALETQSVYFRAS